MCVQACIHVGKYVGTYVCVFVRLCLCRLAAPLNTTRRVFQVVAFVEDQTARLSSEAAETLAQALQSLASWAARRGALNARFLWATYGLIVLLLIAILQYFSVCIWGL